jgi:curved DNA-binding protein CbpA
VSRLAVTNHYQRLGVAPDATPLQLRQAYRRKAFDAHPDRRADDADADMAAINEAWRVLGDRSLRAAYDRSLDASTPRPPRAESPNGTAAPPRAPTRDPLDESDVPLTRSASWTRRWALSIGFLTALAVGFGALLFWIAIGGRI